MFLDARFDLWVVLYEARMILTPSQLGHSAILWILSFHFFSKLQRSAAVSSISLLLIFSLPYYFN